MKPLGYWALTFILKHFLLSLRCALLIKYSTKETKTRSTKNFDDLNGLSLFQHFNRYIFFIFILSFFIFYIFNLYLEFRNNKSFIFLSKKKRSKYKKVSNILRRQLRNRTRMGVRWRKERPYGKQRGLVGLRATEMIRLTYSALSQTLGPRHHYLPTTEASARRRSAGLVLPGSLELLDPGLV